VPACFDLFPCFASLASHLRLFPPGPGECGSSRFHAVWGQTGSLARYWPSLVEYVLRSELIGLGKAPHMLKNVLSSIDLNRLSPQQKEQLTREFEKRKKELEEALKAVNEGLQQLRR